MGQRLENPYRVANMQKALERLRQKQTGRVNVMDFKIDTTDIYVRFRVNSTDDIRLLEADSLFLFEYPLDYEILSYSNFYPPDEEGGRWLYTAVDKGYVFPDIRHEIIEYLFLPRDYTSPGGRLTGFLEVLEDEALKLTGNYEEPDNNSSGAANARNRVTPRGRIQVWDNRTNRLEPVKGVMIQTRRWFYFARTYTNNNGDYVAGRSYKRDPNYKIIFQNSRGFKIWNTIIDINEARMDLGRQSRYGYNFNIYQNSKTWPWATVNNATVAYLAHCSALGIGLPPENLRIVARDKKASSSAPMLRRTWGLFGFTTNSQLANFLLNANGISLAANLLATVTKFAQPDLVISAPKSGLSGNETRWAYNMAFHEMAHASHWSLVGSSYWVKYINYIITYGAYGDGTGANAGYCGVGEMWGNYLGGYVVARREGQNTYWENTFWVEGDDWFNPGFLMRTGLINDITTAEIYSSLNAASFGTLKTYLKTKTVNDNEVDNAFNEYNDWP